MIFLVFEIFIFWIIVYNFFLNFYQLLYEFKSLIFFYTANFSFHCFIYFFNFSNNLKNFDILYALSSIINSGTFYRRIRKMIQLVCRLSTENSHSGIIDENKIRGWVEGIKIQKDICCKDRNKIGGFTFMNTVLYLLNLYIMSVTFVIWKTIFQ